MTFRGEIYRSDTRSSRLTRLNTQDLDIYWDSYSTETLELKQRNQFANNNSIQSLHGQRERRNVTSALVLRKRLIYVRDP